VQMVLQLHVTTNMLRIQRSVKMSYCYRIRAICVGCASLAKRAFYKVTKCLLVNKTLLAGSQCRVAAVNVDCSQLPNKYILHLAVLRKILQSMTRRTHAVVTSRHKTHVATRR
jgi:hypothetical protein